MKQFPVGLFTPENKKATGWGRRYHTGDSGRFNVRAMPTVEGSVAGDAQVKVRGFHIELAEIEIVGQLRARLSVSSPQYMFPAVIVPIDEVPLMAHGKIDRKAVQAFPLPESKVSMARQEEQQKSFTPTQRRLADPWADVLQAHSLAAHWACRPTSSALAVTRCC